MPFVPVSSEASRYWAAYGTIPGWFEPADFLVFDRLLEIQSQGGIRGDLLEIGAYLGRSAILLGLHASPAESVDVCDLFESGPVAEHRAGYRGTAYQRLSRATFERYYGQHVGARPRIHQRPSAELKDILAAASYRFVHLDGSHVYEYVRDDLDTAVRLLQESGIVACDDYRNVNFPGVAAAVWAEVAARRLSPICLTPAKLYATPGDPGPLQERVVEWLDPHPVLVARRASLGAYDVLCVTQRRPVSYRDALRAWVPEPAKRLVRRDREWRGGNDPV